MKGLDLLVEELLRFITHLEIFCDVAPPTVWEPKPGRSPQHATAHRRRTAHRNLSGEQISEQQQEQSLFRIVRVAQFKTHLELAARQHTFIEERRFHHSSREAVDGNPRLPPALAIFYEGLGDP